MPYFTPTGSLPWYARTPSSTHTAEQIFAILHKNAPQYARTSFHTHTAERGWIIRRGEVCDVPGGQDKAPAGASAGREARYVLIAGRSGGVWGRVAEYDGSNIYVWFPAQKWGWKYDSDQTGIISPFTNLLDMEGLMRWLEGYVASTKGADCRKSENDETVTLFIKVPAQGDYSNDYLQFSAIDENDTRQTYVFSKEDGRLFSTKIDTKVFGFTRTILRAESIDYNTAFSASTFTLPSNVEWLDETRTAIAARAAELPMGEFAGISAEAAVEKLFKALNEWDEPMLKVILRAYPLKRIEARGLKGSRLIKKGEPFKSGTYGGVFIPCEIQLSDGRTTKVKLALRNDNQWRVWEVDGGI